LGDAELFKNKLDFTGTPGSRVSIQTVYRRSNDTLQKSVNTAVSQDIGTAPSVDHHPAAAVATIPAASHGVCGHVCRPLTTDRQPAVDSVVPLPSGV